MSQAPSMPVFVDAYLADTSHFTTEEHGAYTLLLFAMWRRNGEVPDDDKDNARVTRMSLPKWRKVKERLRPILTFENGVITQKRLKKEWDYCQEKRAKNAENGAKGGRPRIIENNEIPKANGSVAETQTKANPVPYPIPIEKEEVSLAPVGAVSHETLPLELPDIPKSLDRRPKAKTRQPEPDGFAAFYAEYPLHKARPAAAKAYGAALSRASPAVLLAGAQRYAITRSTEDPKFTKHPATWLSHDCWLDEEPANDYRPAATKNDNLLRGFFEAVVEANGAGGPGQECDDSGGAGAACLALPPPRLRA